MLTGIGSKEPNVLSILAASLHLGMIVWTRERLFFSRMRRGRSVHRVVQLGAVVRSLEHNGAVSEFLDQAILALNGGIRYLGHLVTLETIPSLVASSPHKINNVQRIHKVDEGVPNVAVIGKVDAEVHEVVFTPAGLVNNALEHCLIDLIGDIAQHDGCTHINALSNASHVDMVVLAGSTVLVKLRPLDTDCVLSTAIGTRIPSVRKLAGNHVIGTHQGSVLVMR